MATVKKIDGVHVVELETNYDSLNQEATDRLKEVLIAVGQGEAAPLVLLDLSRTTTINSQVIGLFFSLGNRVRQSGGKFAVCAAEAFCAEVLKIVKLQELFPGYPDRETALANLKHP